MHCRWGNQLLGFLTLAARTRGLLSTCEGTSEFKHLVARAALEVERGHEKRISELAAAEELSKPTHSQCTDQDDACDIQRTERTKNVRGQKLADGSSVYHILVSFMSIADCSIHKIHSNIARSAENSGDS